MSILSLPTTTTITSTTSTTTTITTTTTTTTSTTTSTTTTTFTQVEAIYRMMSQDGDRFGMETVGDMHDQMKLYM